MLKPANIETRKSFGFPVDVLVALILPGMAIFALVFGPQRMWIFLFWGDWLRYAQHGRCFDATSLHRRRGSLLPLALLR
jgi:hypothetical protein